jgi:DNA-binding response OmpR family regulator
MKRRSVLVVEDDDDLRDLMGSFLGDEFAVTLAQDGREAIQLLTRRGEPIDAIVADLEMPRMDGASLVEELRRRGIDVPVLITSAKFDAASRARDVDADFLAKPFHYQQLRQHLEAALQRQTPKPGGTSGAPAKSAKLGARSV